jgi:hypothetical protein
MTGFKQAMQTKDARTENDAVTHSTSGKALVDMFFRMGAMRQRSESDIANTFMQAFGEDREGTLRALFYNRDIRQGQGERRFFRVAFRALAERHPEIARKNLELIPEFGRWDDVWKSTFGTSVEEDALGLIESGLQAEDGLLAKWLPREGSADHETFARIRDFLFDHPSKSYRSKMYRELVSDLSDTVEDKMTSGDWEDVDYGSVPSIASNRYQDAFRRHDEERYSEFIDDALDEDSDVSVNADAIYPYQIIKSVLKDIFGPWHRRPESDARENLKAAQAQWESLPDWMGEGSVLPVVDVSGSMTRQSSPNGPKPIYVAISLGMYCAERNKSAFRDQVMTFSERPSFVEFKSDNVLDRARELKDINWDMNTDIGRMFAETLDRAKSYDVPEHGMPDQILIISDMQFDPSWKPGNTAMEDIERMYGEAGYSVPDVVFWNVDAKRDGVPVKFDKDGTALVSGFSPTIMTNILCGEEMTPRAVMNNVIGNERYDSVRV